MLQKRNETNLVHWWMAVAYNDHETACRPVPSASSQQLHHYDTDQVEMTDSEQRACTADHL